MKCLPELELIATYQENGQTFVFMDNGKFPSTQIDSDPNELVKFLFERTFNTLSREYNIKHTGSRYDENLILTYRVALPHTMIPFTQGEWIRVSELKEEYAELVQEEGITCSS